VIDRIQTGGPGQLNIPTEKVYELGNYNSVATIRDIPDLTFTLESFDVSTEIEQLMVGGSSPFNMSRMRVRDFASHFKAGQTASDPFDVIASVALPQLNPESVSYRFGLRDNARQTFTLRGDSIYYNPGTTWIEEHNDGVDQGDTITFAYGPALAYNGEGTTRYALNVSVDGLRLYPGSDYTEDADGVTFLAAVTAGSVIRIVYSSAAPTRFPGESDAVISAWVDSGEYTAGQLVRPTGDNAHYYRVVTGGTATSTEPTWPTDAGDTVTQDGVVYREAGAYPILTVHEGATVKPAAIRGRDIDIYVGGTAASNRWGSVQSANVDYRATLDRDEEFGNYHAVSQDYDVPEVSGSVEIRPRNPAELFTRVRQATGVTATDEALGPYSSQPLPLWIVLKRPTADAGGALGSPIKTLYVPDARFTVPGYSGQVQQKLNVTINFESDGGQLLIYEGGPPA